MSDFLQDIRYALRQFARTPGFTAVVILTLALGIGANTAIFSFVNGVLLRPLPYVEPAQLVMVCETNPDRPSGWCGGSPANSTDWGRNSRTIESFGLARTWPFAQMVDGKSLGVNGGVATAGVFQVFRVKAALGRVMAAEDMQSGREHVAVVSHTFWRNRLAGRPEAVGENIVIDGQRYTVIGVLPEKFEFPDYLAGAEVWIPLWPERQNRRDWRGFLSFARLAPDASIQAAKAEMETIRASLAAAYPETNAGWGLVVDSLHDRTVWPVRDELVLFQVAVLLVLLIAAANIANLLLARSTGREREFAVRLALGANRSRLVRLMLTESILLSLLGGALGFLIALWSVDLFKTLAPVGMPRLDTVRMDFSVLLFTMILSLATSLFSGLVPALHSSRLELSETLRERSGVQRGHNRIRSLLVVGEVAIAFVLLVSAGLLLRSFSKLLDWQPGFDRRNLVMVPVFTSPGDIKDRYELVAKFRQTATELRALPSVVSVGAGSAGPSQLYGGDGEFGFHVQGRPMPAPGEQLSAEWFDIEPNYFQTFGIPLVRGRYFTEHDNKDSTPVAIINQSMAEKFFPGEDPVGRRVDVIGRDASFQIVGIVADVRPMRPDKQAGPQIFWPFAQAPRYAIIFVIRVGVDPAGVIPLIRDRLEQDSKLQVGRIFTMMRLEEGVRVEPRFNASLVGVFAGIAGIIAMVGIYGVMSFAVVQRTREIGIRIALGAAPRAILRMIVRRGVVLALIGLGIGVVAAFGVTRLLRTLLIGVAPTDPAAFAGAFVVLLIVAMAAGYFPALRATKVDPLVVLRYE